MNSPLFLWKNIAIFNNLYYNYFSAMNMLETGQDWKIAALTNFIHVHYLFWSEKYMYDEKYMIMAIAEAKKALKLDEVPVGAVIVKDGIVVAKAYNQKNTSNIVSRHAEIIAIEEASHVLNNWRLIDCDMYITLEPCPMCMSAIQQSRIKKVYYGIENSDINNRKLIQMIAQKSNTNPGVNLSGGYMKSHITLLMTSFFKKHR